MTDAGAQHRSAPSSDHDYECSLPSPLIKQAGRKPHQRASLTALSILLSVCFFCSFILLDCTRPSPAIKIFLLVSGVAGLVFSLLIFRKFRRRQPRSAQKSDSVLWSIGDDEFTASEASKSDLWTRSREIGRGIMVVYSNGDVYQGEMRNGMWSGSGVYCFTGKGQYRGDWVEGKYDGFGIESWAKGSKYCGQFRQGVRHGLGVYRFYNGDSYAGEWLGGQSHGCGAQTCSDGSCYVGEFKCGVKHGVGCYHFRNGDRYTGEYFGDRIHGFGVYNFASGHCYEGSWHEGRRQGFGTYIFINGEKISGEWDCGILKIKMLPSEAAVQRSVLAARKAVENAMLLPQVAEEANVAAAAACRAANVAQVAAAKSVRHQMEGNFFRAF